jgi:anthranilate phosphoribosyltransferase
LPHAQPFAEALRHESEEADARWRGWATGLLDADKVTPGLLHDVWKEAVAYDETLARFAAHPVPVPPGTVIVSGSGKETFKTFNVSTAAALMAAAAGVSVVKGTSASVSAVSGSADVLAVLGIPVLADPLFVTREVAVSGIAFVNYSSFCPRYAGRYDGRFTGLSPMSFFMPAAAVMVAADAFLHGLAHDDVGTAAHGIRAARPDLARGRVVTTLAGPGMRVDEIAPVGKAVTAEMSGGRVTISTRARSHGTGAWCRAVAHRADHVSNAALLLDSLRPDAVPALADFVDANAAAIVCCARAGTTDSDALALVREARYRGASERVLDVLRQGNGQRETR